MDSESVIYSFQGCGDPAAPLCIFVHGRGGNLRIMSGFSRYIPESCSQLFIQAPIPDPIGGYSWWLIDDPLSDPWKASLLLEPMLKRIFKNVGITPKFLVGLGFSQGGAVFSMALQRDPHLLKGLALLASFVVRPSPEFGEVSGSLGRPPSIFIAHGENDSVVSIDEARRGEQYLRSLGWRTSMIVDPVEHKVGVGGMRGLKEWIYDILQYD